LQQWNEDIIIIAATKIALCALVKIYLIPKNSAQKILGKRQHYSKLNRVKAKLYVSKTYRLRGLIMELYIPPSSNGRDCLPRKTKTDEII